MKKIFTFVFALLAFAAVQAQSLLSEDFENGIPSTWLNVDSDGDEHFWMSSADITGVTGHNSNGCAYSQSYDNDLSTALTPDNWLITPSVLLTSNSNLTFWVCAQDASWAEEHYGVYISTTGTSTSDFTLLMEETIDANGGSRDQGTWKQKIINLAAYTGQTVYIAFRHFNCTDMFYFNLDDVEIFAQPTSPTISTNSTSLDFGINPIGIDLMQQVNVIGYNLTTGITATATAPYTVSTDGASFAATATIDTLGGTLYVRYTPTTAGVETGTVTLSANGATSVTINLNGEAVDCSGGINTLPFTYDFNTGTYPPICWTVGSEESFEATQVSEEEEDNAIVFVDADYLITPEIQSTNALLLSFDYASDLGSDFELPTKFRVGYSSTDNNISSFTWQPENTITSSPTESNFFNYVTVIPANTKHIAIQVTELGYALFFGIFEITDVFYLDNITITELSESMMLVDPETINFGSIPFGSAPVVKTANVVGALLTSDITVTAPSNFEVSSDGVNYAATATLPQDGGNFYARYNPTAIGSHSGNITLTSGSTTQNIAVSGNAVDCSMSYPLPFTENFESGEFPPTCWLVNTSSSGTWMGSVVEDNPMAICAYGNQGEPQNEDLITPAINMNGATSAVLSFDFMASYTYVHNEDENEQYNLVVYGSTDDGATYSPIYNMRNDQGEFTSWTSTTVTLNVSSFTNHPNVRFKFNYNGVYGANLYLDNIAVREGGDGVDDYDNNEVRVYPNPANNVLNINANSNISRVEVYNMMGQMIGSYNANDVNTQINTNGFANGLYTVKIQTENGTSTQKFTVAR